MSLTPINRPQMDEEQTFRTATQFMMQTSKEKSQQEDYHYKLCLGFALTFFYLQIAISAIITLLSAAEIGNHFPVSSLSILNISLSGILSWMSANDLPERKYTSSRNYEKVISFINNKGAELQAGILQQNVAELVGMARILFDDAEDFAARHPTRVTPARPRSNEARQADD
jgi:hypothetical protein